MLSHDRLIGKVLYLVSRKVLTKFGVLYPELSFEFSWLIMILTLMNPFLPLGFTSCLPHGLFVSRMVWNSNVAV